MTQKTLRQLAKGYADGLIQKDSYRSQRAELLENILAGKVAVEPNEYLPPISMPDESQDITEQKEERQKDKEESDITAFVPQASAETAAPAEPVAVQGVTEEKSKTPLLIGIVVTLVVLVAVVAFMMIGSDKPGPGETGPAEVMADKVPGKGQTMIQNFLDNKLWTDTELDNFINEWNLLSPDEKAVANDSLEFRRLTNSIYKQLLEERALSGLGDAATSLEKQRKLVSFARELGISDSRISIPGE